MYVVEKEVAAQSAEHSRVQLVTRHRIASYACSQPASE